MDSSRAYLTLQEAADQLKVELSTLRRYIREEGLPARRLHSGDSPRGHVRILASELEAWVRTRPLLAA